MKTIELKEIGDVVIREFDNDDRELIQNESTQLTQSNIPNTNKVNSNAKVLIGSLNKYTFILGVAKAPFFTTEITEDGITNDILQSRLKEYKKIDFRIIETLVPAIAEYNQIDEKEYNRLKKNSS